MEIAREEEMERNRRPVAGGRKTAARKKRRVGPKSTDRHRLYEEAVQSPAAHIEFFDRVYRLAHGKPARTLKEDFCGTAVLSAEWVKTRSDNVAVGVDLDRPTLKWARENNIAPLNTTGAHASN